MYIKENIVRLIVILMVIFFAAGAFFMVRFFRKEFSIATNPSKEVISSNSGGFDFDTYQEALKKIQ